MILAVLCYSPERVRAASLILYDPADMEEPDPGKNNPFDLSLDQTAYACGPAVDLGDSNAYQKKYPLPQGLRSLGLKIDPDPSSTNQQILVESSGSNYYWGVNEYSVQSALRNQPTQSWGLVLVRDAYTQLWAAIRRFGGTQPEFEWRKVVPTSEVLIVTGDKELPFAPPWWFSQMLSARIETLRKQSGEKDALIETLQRGFAAQNDALKALTALVLSMDRKNVPESLEATVMETASLIGYEGPRDPNSPSPSSLSSASSLSPRYPSSS